MTVQSRLDPSRVARIRSVTPLDGVRAGSALLSVGHRLMVVGDDAHAVSWVEPATGVLETQPLDRSAHALPKLLKPDFEAAAEAPDGSIWIFGSGSLANRRGIVRLGGSAHSVTRYDGTPLYLAIGSQLGVTPNIEGALFVEDALLLCHRGTADRPDVLLEIEPPTALTDSPRIRQAREVRPPAVVGVPAHVTDLASLHESGVALLAAAEDTNDPIADGPVAGALVGLWRDDVIEWVPLLDVDGTPTASKPEGLVFGEDGAGGWLVTDRDDPRLAAELCRFELTDL